MVAVAVGAITFAIGHPPDGQTSKLQNAPERASPPATSITTGSSKLSDPGPVASKAPPAKPLVEQFPDPLTLAQNYRSNLDPIGLQIECEKLLSERELAIASTERAKAIRETCLFSPLEHLYVAHYDRHIAGKEAELLAGANSVLSKLHPDPIMDTEYATSCPTGTETDFRKVIYFSWASIALKAYLIAQSFDAGEKTIELLDRGENPQEALPTLPLTASLKPAPYISEAYRVLTTYQIDRLLARYSDEQLLSWGTQLVGLLPAATQNRLRKVVQLYLEQYQRLIKPKSSDLARLYREHMARKDWVRVNSGRVISNFPTGTFHLSCLEGHVEGFWLRRLMSGTAARFEILAEKFLNLQ